MKQDQSFPTSRPSFSLPNFEGPLELLLYLIQKEELDVCDIFLKEVTEQFFKGFEKTSSIDEGSDFLALASTLLVMKSRKLLPVSEQENLAEEEEDARFNLIQHLLEYCRFKEIADGLLEKEERERIFFPRNAPLFAKHVGTGLEEVALPELAALFEKVLQRSTSTPHFIQDEEWQVAPAMQWLKNVLAAKGRLLFNEVFSEEKYRGELIVLFLALLEMMKYQQACLIKEGEMLWLKYMVSHE